MNQCLRITLKGIVPEGFLHSFVQKHARKLRLEGTAQSVEDDVRIVVYGDRDDVSDFLDFMHKGSTAYKPNDIEIEPFLKVKDYRGVFRVIE